MGAKLSLVLLAMGGTKISNLFSITTVANSMTHSFGEVNAALVAKYGSAALVAKYGSLEDLLQLPNRDLFSIIFHRSPKSIWSIWPRIRHRIDFNPGIIEFFMPIFNQYDTFEEFFADMMEMCAVRSEEKLKIFFNNPSMTKKDCQNAVSTFSEGTGHGRRVPDVMRGKGIDPRILGNNWRDMLFYGENAYKNWRKILRRHFEGWDINSPIDEDGVPLTLAAFYNRPNLMKLLVLAGADVNQKGLYGGWFSES